MSSKGLIKGFRMLYYKHLMSVFFLITMFSAAAIGQVPLSIPNPGFESGATGWSNATVGDWEYYAPPEGTQYANRNPADGETAQLTGHIISAGETDRKSVV